jgi:hypothetical protein
MLRAEHGFAPSRRWVKAVLQSGGLAEVGRGQELLSPQMLVGSLRDDDAGQMLDRALRRGRSQGKAAHADELARRE